MGQRLVTQRTMPAIASTFRSTAISLSDVWRDLGKTVACRDSEEVICVYGGPLVACSAASTEGDS